MDNVINQAPFLRTSRQYPEESHQLAVELDKTYVDVANAVNNRTISIFPKNKPAITGESFFLTSSRQQTFRQVYTATATTVLPHTIKFFSSQPYFTRMYGQYTDGTNWYGLIPGSNVAIAGQISFYLDPVNINFVVGGGAPVPTKLILVLEWMSNV